MLFRRAASLLLISVSCCVAPIARAQSVEAPVFAAGNSWEFQNSDLWSNKLISRVSSKVVGVSGDFVRLSYENTNVGNKFEIVKPTVTESTIRADLNSIVMYRGEKMDKIPFKWPLEQGKKWTYSYKMDLPLTGTSTVPTTTYNVSAEVKGWESVEVPAGKFRAIKIVYKSNWTSENPSSSGSSVGTSWYSPDAKTNVQSIFEAIGADGMPQTRTESQLVLYKTESK